MRLCYVSTLNRCVLGNADIPSVHEGLPNEKFLLRKQNVDQHWWMLIRLML